MSVCCLPLQFLVFAFTPSRDRIQSRGGVTGGLDPPPPPPGFLRNSGMHPYCVENHKAVGFIRNSGMNPYCMENHKDVGFLRNSGMNPYCVENHKSCRFP